jgi:hypothetical protein
LLIISDLIIAFISTNIFGNITDKDDGYIPLPLQRPRNFNLGAQNLNSKATLLRTLAKEHDCSFVKGSRHNLNKLCDAGGFKVWEAEAEILGSLKWKGGGIYP